MYRYSWEPPIKEYRQMAHKSADRLKGSANLLLSMPRDEKVYKDLEQAAHEEAVATLKTSRPGAAIPVPKQEVVPDPNAPERIHLPPLVEEADGDDDHLSPGGGNMFSPRNHLAMSGSNMKTPRGSSGRPSGGALHVESS